MKNWKQLLVTRNVKCAILLNIDEHQWAD